MRGGRGEGGGGDIDITIEHAYLSVCMYMYVGITRPTLGNTLLSSFFKLNNLHLPLLLVFSSCSLYKVNEWLCDWEARGGRDVTFSELMGPQILISQYI